MKKIKAGIVGGAGYTGGEMIRLLINHPQAEIAFINSSSNAGNPVTRIHADLAGDTDMLFTDKLSNDIDVLFLCVGHGDAKKFLDQNPVADNVKVIDLSQDFRLKSRDTSGENRKFVYGLPELNREAIRDAKNIANPGCFATAIQLGLLPLAKRGILGEVYTTGITGSTGAGQGLNATSHFSWRANNVQAYKTLQHQHINEIHQSLRQLQEDTKAHVHFVPWRGDFARGIYVTSIVHCALDVAELQSMYELFYAGQAFTHVLDKMIDLKQVVNTNKCLIHIEKQGDKLAIHSAIDNLLKGASGQAVQNMNLLFGFDETTGLRLKPAAF
ncbi:N-acetyl-gamma-glutamyl-phosphate reductase [Sediminibacterium soli]|uniref:N-acetyl-gamma-glutamyl-phosphate reductase n=1 Tax=Sediminibacterium soli TaxID=2698829 RepID=UPI00137A0779|nr:N-acetyl-gamma-glutamyl-phosphate reductase [Sediminibacterium soli]NCI47653.1 N-acetyl-gamma-glutamyl-phosphate reductase [Sediminibacterium soli]